MREEEGRPGKFSGSPEWTPLSLFELHAPAPQGSRLAHKGNSFSGGERNRLFLNRDGVDFHAATLVSGLDKKEDARSWAWVDLDGDGWLDVLLVGPQQPRFRAFRNRIGEILPDHRSVRITLEGGNEEPVASSEWSPRQPVGARVLARWGDGRQRLLHLAAGEGLAAQNEGALHLGLGTYDGVVDLEVTWPSGRVSRHEVEAGAGTVHLRERP